MSTELLSIANLHAFYGESHILHGVDFSVNKGELVTLLGRNGAGRTTTLKSVLGLVGKRTGSVKVNGVETIDMATHKIAHLGLGYCPEERGIFASLSCEENLMLPPAVGDGGMSVSEIYAMFPNLRERRSSPGMRLSGGEQQMLAVARILRTGAEILLFDEITEGLAPVIVQALGRVIRTLKERGYTIILVEQNFRFAAPLADRHYVMEQDGSLQWSARKNSRRRWTLCTSIWEFERHFSEGIHSMKLKQISAMVSAALLSLTAGAALAQQVKISDDVVKIGVLSDMSGLYADIGGPGAVIAAKMAVEDFGGKVLGKPIEVISADHQNKADIGKGLATQWFDQDKVDMIENLNSGRSRGSRCGQGTSADLARRSNIAPHRR
jgi:branched-chain amino acid transport system ATP-binding protein